MQELLHKLQLFNLGKPNCHYTKTLDSGILRPTGDVPGSFAALCQGFLALMKGGVPSTSQSNTLRQNLKTPRQHLHIFCDCASVHCFNWSQSLVKHAKPLHYI